jgi:dihydrolipoamide dehydrogenase
MNFREITSTMASPGYNIHSDQPANSWAQWLVDDQDRLVGATFVGSDAAELLHASTVAIVGKIPLSLLMHAIPSFPTLSWVYYNLMDAAGL